MHSRDQWSRRFMPPNRDHWGEPIPASRRTFSLATLFRLLTAGAILLGWLSVVHYDDRGAVLVLAGITTIGAAVAAHRQRGDVWKKAIVGCLFLLGVPFVALYVAAVFVAFVTPTWATPNHDELRVFGACMSVLTLPLVAIVFVGLLRLWLHLAADAADWARPKY
jgi:hypothetical protein